VKTSEQRVYSSVHGEGRGGSRREHAEKEAAAPCGRMLFVVQQLLHNVYVYLPWALLSTGGLAEEVR